jgi:hypothetical protein
MAEDKELIGDLTITDDELYCNNTFNLKALNDTLEKLSVTNFWSLYQTQRSRLRMERFNIPINQFLSTNRLAGEKKQSFYPRRHIAYINYTFIEPELRKKYRNSDLYNTAVNQTTISKNPDIFRFNYMIFIDGEFIYTTEVYPQESKLGIIIDLQTSKNEHGLTYEQFTAYKKKQATVTVIIVPNYDIVNVNSNAHILEALDYKIPFSKITDNPKFNKDTLCFVNLDNEIGKRYYEENIIVDEASQNILVDREINPGGNKYRFCFVTLNFLHKIEEVSYENPFFKVDTKMPCPIEQMIAFVWDDEGRFLFRDIEIKMYYPNIYEVRGLNEGDIAKVVILQDEVELTTNEKYKNELAKYEEYVDMLPKYVNGSIPDIIKRYRPSSYVYSISDYNNSMYVPSTLSYKVEKLHKTIYENPWALAVYLDLLNLPTDKFYLDMSTIDLSNRLRRDSTNEELDDSIIDIKFDSDRYVFAMNRHFVNTRSYGFRIFIDGYFQTEVDYTILPGPDFYYIYLPANKIKEDSVVEIERYKLFSFEHYGSTDSLNEPILELELKDRNTIGYSREIYVVDTTNNRYLSKEKDIRIDVLYGFAKKEERWVTIPSGRNIPIENKVRVYITNEEYLGKKLKIGISRTMAMITGDDYSPTEDTLHSFTIFEYSELKLADQGNYDLGNYRMFNNGKILLPNQYFMAFARYQGKSDIAKTSCELFEGDRFTLDRTPARFTVIYYQNEIDEVNKKGYVDLDGKVELPVSLKWYDIYVNGVKLHKKNIEIISPTKFYIQGVDSRKHLMIMMRNRDPEVFKLAEHNVEFDTKDYNNTIIDELMESIGELKEIIDDTKSEIDPNNETKEIATNIVINQSALIFFFEYFVYTFINANYKQITQEIKDAFPSLINEQGIMEIDSNQGCIDSDSIAGYLIKMVECNYIDERSADMFTKDSVSYDGLGTLQDRFAIRPLNTTNYEYGLPQEFMCDPETGEPAIMNEDGTVTTVSTLFRTKNFIESFSENTIMYGMGKADIYQIVFDDEYKVHVYEDDENIITEDIITTKPVTKFAIGLDATFLTQVGESRMLKLADVDPTVEVTYLDGDDEKHFSHSITRLHNYVIDTDGYLITLKSIKLKGISEGVKTFIHSLLIAF